MSKDYRCENLPRGSTTVCSDFSPSAVVRQGKLPSIEEQRQHQAKCTEAVKKGDTLTYAEMGCKRYAHVQVPQGREGARKIVTGQNILTEVKPGLDAVSPATRFSRDDYNYTRRTQNIGSSWRERAAPIEYLTSREDRLNALLEPMRKGDRIVITLPKNLVDLENLKQVADRDRVDKLIRVARTKKSMVFIDKTKEKIEISDLVLDIAFKRFVLTEAVAQLNDPVSIGLNTAVSEDSIVFKKRNSTGLLVYVRSGEKVKKIKGQFAKIVDNFRRAPLIARSSEEAEKRQASYDLAVYRFLRQKFWSLETSNDYAIGAYLSVSPDKVFEIKLPHLKMQHFLLGDASDKAEAKDYYRLRGLNTSDLIQYLLGDHGPDPRRRRKGRYSEPLSSFARDNSVSAAPRNINLSDFEYLAPGESAPVGGDFFVYRKDRKEGPNKHGLVLVPGAQLRTWRTLSASAKARDPKFSHQLPLSRAPRQTTSPLSQENPMSRRFRDNPNDAVDALLAEFGPTAGLGEDIVKGSPVFDSVYPASGDFGPYGLRDAPYGARSSLPVNRRNPAPEGTWRHTFGQLARRAQEIQKDPNTKDKNGRPCTMKEAFALAKAELEAEGKGYTPRKKRLAAVPTAANNPRNAAERKPRKASEYDAHFKVLVQRAQAIQVRRGCSLSDAFSQAMAEEKIERKKPAGYWREQRMGKQKAAANPHPDAELRRMSGAELTGLANQGYDDAAEELARREAARANPRRR